MGAIVDGEFTAADADTHYKSLEPSLGDLILDDSLKTALPITCVKPKAERGAFDNMVITELEKAFSKKTAELTQILAEAAPKNAERDAAVEAAETHVKDAEESQKKAAEELASAKESEKQSYKAVKRIEAEVAAYEPERLKVEAEKDARATVLGNFKEYNIGCFELLRDQTSKPAATPEEEIEKVEPTVVS